VVEDFGKYGWIFGSLKAALSEKCGRALDFCTEM
jgi:hypothetical protein